MAGFRSVWHGVMLGPYKAARPASFIARGHRCVFYSYQFGLDMPAGGNCHDASLLIPSGAYFDCGPGPGEGSQALFSSLFRLTPGQDSTFSTRVHEQKAHMLILAHRGLHHDAAENTVAAFDKAITTGVDGIETDVRISSDGELVLFHDPCAPDGSPVDLLTRSELGQICGYEVPSLPEVLAEWPDIMWNLEIKSRSVVKPLAQLLREKGNLNKCLVSSFVHSAVLELTLQLDVQGGLLVAHDPLEGSIKALFSNTMSPRLKSIVFDFRVLSPRTIEAAIQNGLIAYAYNTKSKEDHEHARSSGLHGIITDHPEYLLR